MSEETKDAFLGILDVYRKAKEHAHYLSVEPEIVLVKAQLEELRKRIPAKSGKDFEALQKQIADTEHLLNRLKRNEEAAQRAIEKYQL